jgi:hypothetical protein
MTDIPDDLISWRLKGAQKSDGQFHHSQAGSEVAAVFSRDINDLRPDISR